MGKSPKLYIMEEGQGTVQGLTKNSLKKMLNWLKCWLLAFFFQDKSAYNSNMQTNNKIYRALSENWSKILNLHE